MWTGSGQEGARSAQRHYEREGNTQHFRGGKRSQILTS